MGILKAIGNKAMGIIYGGAKFIARHPLTGYFLIGIPACVLMCNGAMSLAGEGIDLSDEVKKEERK